MSTAISCCQNIGVSVVPPTHCLCQRWHLQECELVQIIRVVTQVYFPK
jgi:hypothetical protein